jgi:hypothetical protein
MSQWKIHWIYKSVRAPPPASIDFPNYFPSRLLSSHHVTTFHWIFPSQNIVRSTFSHLSLFQNKRIKSLSIKNKNSIAFFITWCLIQSFAHRIHTKLFWSRENRCWFFIANIVFINDCGLHNRITSAHQLKLTLSRWINNSSTIFVFEEISVSFGAIGWQPHDELKY